MLDLLENALAKRSGAWLELRLHDRRSRSILVEDGVLEAARATRHCGVGVRAFVDGGWGFASTSVLTPEALLRMIDAAVDAARAAALGRTKKALPPLPAAFRNGTYKSPARQPLSSLSLDDKIALVMKTDAAVRSAGQRITSSSAKYTELCDQKFIVTSDGARVVIEDDKPELRVQAVAALEGELQSCVESAGQTGGFGDLFARRSAEEMALKAAQTATDLLRAGYVDGGKKQVILAPDVVGLLVHEAIGHTVEADFVLAGSAAAGKLGQQVASDLVTLCDSGQSEYIPGAGGVVLVDDEGVPAEKVTIIEKGVLKSYLHNRETAQLFGVAPTGNARAFEFDNEPLVRMRNTYIEPGATPLPDMIKETDDGWLLVGAKNGQADANAEFMFVVGEAYPIKDGKLGPLHRGTTITGDAFEVLRSVDRVGDVFAWELGSGYCGKGQPAKVDAGGPHIRCLATLAGNSKEGG
ncbi:MAG: TldD/PmbA family protein [Deltaproteobacteria bacterium]|nr:TldD/PmbA family protein [Deltaproteobacteria bacterium]